MFCKHCGAKIPDNSVFCSKCGQPLSSNSQPTAPVKKEYMRQEPSLNLDRYRQMIHFGYLIDGIATVVILVIWFLMEPVHFDSYYFDRMFNWPVIIGGILALIVCSAIIQILSGRRATSQLIADIEQAGNQIMWNTYQTNKPYFKTIQGLSSQNAATITITNILLSNALTTTKSTEKLIQRMIIASHKQIGLILMRCAHTVYTDMNAEE